MVVQQKRQQGVVLLVSLIFLIGLTAVASALMQVTTSDMKMSGATEDKTTAVQETLGATDEVIFNEVGNEVTMIKRREQRDASEK